LVGVVLVKNILAIDPSRKFPLHEIDLVKAPKVNTEIPLYTLLGQFISGKCHMAFVHDPKDNLTILGVVTLEDIIEELIDSEIYDETDYIVPERPEYVEKSDKI